MKVVVQCVNVDQIPLAVMVEAPISDWRLIATAIDKMRGEVGFSSPLNQFYWGIQNAISAVAAREVINATDFPPARLETPPTQ